MNGGLTLPRLLTRSRRRKPRGPEWRRMFIMLLACLALAVAAVLVRLPFTAAGMSLTAFSLSRALRWWPQDPEGPRPTVRQLHQQIALTAGGSVLCIVGIFA